MPTDPLSHVASWLTPASADVTDKPPRTSPFDPVAEAEARLFERMAQARARAVSDPVLALIAEGKRLDALWDAAITRGDEAEDLASRACEVGNQIRNTKPVTLAGAIAILKLGHESGCCEERLTSTVIAGLCDMQPEPADPAVIGFGEPKEGGAA